MLDNGNRFREDESTTNGKRASKEWKALCPHSRSFVLPMEALPNYFDAHDDSPHASDTWLDIGWITECGQHGILKGEGSLMKGPLIIGSGLLRGVKDLLQLYNLIALSLLVRVDCLIRSALISIAFASVSLG